MPTNQELAIILKLKDELTGALNRVVQSAGKEMDSLGHRMKEFGREVTQVGRNLTFLGAEITGVFSVSLAVAQRYSLQVSNAIRDLNAQHVRFQLIIAQALVPVLNQLTALLSRVVDAFQKMNPATRDAIIQWTAIGGVLLIAAGLIDHLFGNLIKLVGQILIWAGSITVAYGGIVLLVAVIGTVIVAIVGWQKTLIGVARAIDVVIQAVRVAAEVILTGFTRALAFATGAAEEFFRFLSQHALKDRAYFKQMADDLKVFREALDQTSLSFAGDAVKDVEVLIQRFKEGGGTTEDFARHLQELIDKLKAVKPAGSGMIAFVQSFKAQWTQTLKEALDFGKTFADATIGFFRNLESGVARSVENVILHGGKFKNFLKELGRSIVQSFVSMVSQLIAHILIWLPILLLLNAIPGGTFILKALDLSSSFIGPTISAARSIPKQHQGGLIQRFQTGGEVLAMLEPGEFVVNRRSTERNRELLESINAGRGGSGPGSDARVAVLFNINAIDPKTGAEFLMRNSKAIADAVNQEILRNNQGYRRTSRRFA